MCHACASHGKPTASVDGKARNTNTECQYTSTSLPVHQYTSTSLQVHQYTTASIPVHHCKYSPVHRATTVQYITSMVSSTAQYIQYSPPSELGMILYTCIDLYTCIPVYLFFTCIPKCLYTHILSVYLYTCIPARIPVYRSMDGVPVYLNRWPSDTGYMEARKYKPNSSIKFSSLLDTNYNPFKHNQYIIFVQKNLNHHMVHARFDFRCARRNWIQTSAGPTVNSDTRVVTKIKPFLVLDLSQFHTRQHLLEATFCMSEPRLQNGNITLT